MPESLSPVDRMARWSTPEGGLLRVRILDHLSHGRSLRALEGPDLDLCGIDLRGARLAAADLKGARLEHARLDGADLTGARLDGANLRAVSGIGVTLDRASLADADLSIANFTRASFRFAILPRARLGGATFLGADLIGADLRGASLALCDLEEAWLIGVDLGRAPRPHRPGSLASHAAQAGFPTFGELIQGGQYLAVMNVTRPEITLRKVESVVLVCRDREGEMLALLGERNWRPHMIAAAAMVYGAASPAVLAAAWLCVDTGTWAAPQLAAALLLTDPDFEACVRARLLNPPRDYPGKSLASLAAARRRLAGAAAGALDEDDEGGRITDRWLSRMLDAAPSRVRAGWAGGIRTEHRTVEGDEPAAEAAAAELEVAEEPAEKPGLLRRLLGAFRRIKG